MAVYFPQGVMTLRVILEDFQQSSDARLQKVYTWTVKCKRLRVNLNSYREADTFDAEIDYKNFPFDPRIIRACGVSIFMEDKEQIFDTAGGNRLDTIVPSPENIIFQGFADTDKIQLTPDTRSVRLEGRDFTSLLIDREYFGEPINNAVPLDVVLRELLDQLPQTKFDAGEPGKGLLIEKQPPDLEIPTLAELTGSKDSMAGQKNPRKKRSYWDMMQELVADAGLIAYVAIDKLVITKPRNLYNKDKAKVFIYGRNVSSLEFERKLGRQKGFNVRVISLNESKKSIIEAKIPEEATEDWCRDIGIKREPISIPTMKAHGPSSSKSAATGIATGEANSNTTPTNISGAQGTADNEPAPYFTFRIKDVVDKDHLVSIGEKIFEELGRQQIEGKLTTKEMVVASKSEGGFSAMKFRIGTPIEVTIDQGDIAGVQAIVQRNNPKPKDELQAQQQLTTKQLELARFLRGRGYKSEIADVMSVALTKFQTPFFTKGIEFTIDQESGFEMAIDFINFIEIPQNLVEPTLK